MRGHPAPPTAPPSAGLRRTAARVDRALEAYYGRPRRRRTLDPVSMLVLTILSQNTSDTNSATAFDRLRARFPAWGALREAPVREVIDAIRPAGLAVLKAPRLQAALRRITAERGALSLDFLRRWPAERAKAWLRSLDGVGPKTAAIVLIFGLGKPAFAVDTHVYRTGRRIGFIPPHLSAEEAHAWMEAVVRRTRYGPFHLLLVRHGREVCKALRPRCPVCPVRGFCAFYTARRRAASRSAPRLRPATATRSRGPRPSGGSRGSSRSRRR